MTPTPETDAAILIEPFYIRQLPFEVVKVDICEKLERERDEAKAIIESLEDALIEIEACCYEDDSENAAADASWHIARKALRKLKEWTKEKEAVS